LKKMVYLHRLE